MGEATMWPSMMLFTVHYAKRFARYGGKEQDFYVTEFIGYFFFVFQLCQVFGNLISYAILFAGKDPISTNTTLDSNTTDATPPAPPPGLIVCGPNDCQDPNITALNIAQYVPAAETTLYIVYGVMGSMVLLAIAIHVFLVRRINPDLEIKESKLTGVENKALDVAEVQSNGVVASVFDVVPTYEIQPADKAIQEGGVIENGGVYDDDFDVASTIFTEAERDLEKADDDKGYLEFAFSIIKATILHLFNPRQLLIIPFALYSGIYSSFVFAELTRAFASCILGVDQVGLCMAIFCSINAFVSFFIGKISSRIGRNIPLCFALCVDIANYMWCLFWVPTESTTWLVYVLFFSFGITDGIWNPLVNDMHASYFQSNQETAFTVWNLFVLSGFAIQFGWSTSLCVRYKIYIQIGLVCASMVCYGIAEFVLKPKLPEKFDGNSPNADKTSEISGKSSDSGIGNDAQIPDPFYHNDVMAVNTDPQGTTDRSTPL
uniref:UNC93-like protein n=1 Tax=Phallusia mammillata TaxID=59560 RepID=A0A6F9DLF1_9ASCI|nr:UNC93-like protein [Phallusia mammillata]